ncbi:MAG TPA: isocitrate lyase/phosphoenolpyruvate mutase family protein [Streptosporangiaceae bacterium]|jgi:2-methylisocitrate lyase-like PEP mutase family enzyme
MTNDQTAAARRFHELHVAGRPLVLTNAWDVASARLAEDAGAAAIATTSAGVAWSLGVPDGDLLDRAHAAGAVARIAAATGLPVTADIEGGLGDVAATVRAVLAAGAVGVNLEDTGGGRLLDVGEQLPRLAAARGAAGDAGVPLYVNARIDTYLTGLTGTDALAATLERARAYLDAGADGIFVPGVAAPEVIKELAAAVPAPLNIMAGPGSPSVPDLAALGVARVSLGSGIAEAAYAVMAAAAREALTTGTYDTLANGLPYGRLNTLLSNG